MTSRDLAGYAGKPPHPGWPGSARLALQFVLNIEEGAESCVLNGDACSEAYLHELPGRPARQGQRDLSVESLYEYGSRAGVWRILELFRSRDLPLTAFAVGRALELNPAIGAALHDDGHEIAGHGYRWLDYHDIPADVERQHISMTVEAIRHSCGKRPVGWYTGRVSPNTRRLLQAEGGFLYTSDAYNDDLPYWAEDSSLLVIPYTLANNDARYLWPNGFASGDEFFGFLRDGFDQLWMEGATSPKMMTVGLHGRISGQPARAHALARFLDYVAARDAVWTCRREEIARHWHACGPRPPDGTAR
ncbi:MAG: polysaccharide deacetylase family protein [Pseudomonadales bacterium]|nr:polysaccharide deacetylase family protein [Pseudomonadales bacterium]MCP5189972.1 polysaccharide deacetylase family protein [Pseudomonadales bacterium]